MGKSLKEHRGTVLKIRERNPDEANRLSKEQIESVLHSIEEDKKRKVE